MGPTMMGSGQTIAEMEREFKYTPMEINTMAPGLTIRDKAEVNLLC